MAANDTTNTPAPGSLPAHLSPQEMTHEQLKDWEATGNAPARDAADDDTPADQPAEAAAATPVDRAASTDANTSAASETAKPHKQKAPGQKLSAKERAAQIDAENAGLQEKLKLRKALREELAGLDVKPKQDEKPKRDPSTAAEAIDAKEPEWKKYRAMPDAPKAKDYQDLEDFSAAMGHFIATKIAKEQFDGMFDARTAEERKAMERDGEFSALVDETEARVTAELQSDPEILNRIPDRWKALNPSDRRMPGEELTPAHFVKDRVTFHSKNTLKLSEKLCADDFTELNRIARLSPDKIIYELAVMDASFNSADGDDDTTDETPRSNRVSKAPAPPSTLGRKPASGVDPLKAAIKDNDYLAFEREENAREVARNR